MQFPVDTKLKSSVLSAQCDCGMLNSVPGSDDPLDEQRRDPLRYTCEFSISSKDKDGGTGTNDESFAESPTVRILGTRVVQMVEEEVSSDYDATLISHGARERAAPVFPKPGRGHRVKIVTLPNNEKKKNGAGRRIAWVDGKFFTLL
jgi:hypothetical protein